MAVEIIVLYRRGKGPFLGGPFSVSNGHYIVQLAVSDKINDYKLNFNHFGYTDNLLEMRREDKHRHIEVASFHTQMGEPIAYALEVGEDCEWTIQIRKLVSA